MKPDLASPDRTDSAVDKAAVGDSSTVAAGSMTRLPKTLWFITALYAGWLVYLAYVAWVNVQAGNQ